MKILGNLLCLIWLIFKATHTTIIEVMEKEENSIINMVYV